MYLDQSRSQIDQLKTAVAENDCDAILTISHQLKGSSANLGANKLADVCSRLESAAKENQLNDSASLFSEIQGTFERTQVQFQAQLDQ